MNKPGVSMNVIKEKILPEKGPISQQVYVQLQQLERIGFIFSFIKDKALHNLSNNQDN